MELYRENVKRILAQMNQVVIGKEEVVSKVLMAILAKGHILLEDVPGVGKTTLAVSFSRAMELQQNRIQFTPDVLPSDVVGYTMISRESHEEIYKPGAVMCNLLLADEINRTSSKTQSALLEVMEERKVTVDKVTREVPNPFTVIATQNPKGSVGTQLLPDSQLDRFMVRLSMGYPDMRSEVNMLKNHSAGNPLSEVEKVITKDQLIAMQDDVDRIYLHETLYEYIVWLVQRTRDNANIDQGVSPRGTLALMNMAKAVAYCYNRDYVIPDDIKYIFKDVVKHRIVLSGQARLKSVTKDMVTEDIMRKTRMPRIVV